MARETIESIPVERPHPSRCKPQGMRLDNGYDYAELPALLKEFGFTADIRSGGEEVREIKKESERRALRWVVERSHSWMNRFRGILIR